MPDERESARGIPKEEKPESARPIEDKPGTGNPPDVILATGLPPPGTPVAFADGVTNLAHSNYITKFYLYRTDPTVDNSGLPKNNIVGQIVMPIDAFVRTSAFLSKAVDMLIANQVISKEEVVALTLDQEQHTKNQ